MTPQSQVVLRGRRSGSCHARVNYALAGARGTQLLIGRIFGAIMPPTQAGTAAIAQSTFIPAMDTRSHRAASGAGNTFVAGCWAWLAMECGYFQIPVTAVGGQGAFLRSSAY